MMSMRIMWRWGAMKSWPALTMLGIVYDGARRHIVTLERLAGEKFSMQPNMKDPASKSPGERR